MNAESVAMGKRWPFRSDQLLVLIWMRVSIPLFSPLWN